MKNSKHELGVYIGRFQPYHNGHHQTVLRMLNECKEVLILIGSHESSPSIKNPWDSYIRKNMIEDSLPSITSVHFDFIHDFHDNNRWIAEVQRLVHKNAKRIFRWRDNDMYDVALYGHAKDESTWYLNAFPLWKFVETANVDILNATDIRNIYYGYPRSLPLSYLDGVLPIGTKNILAKYRYNDSYELIADEMKHAANYEKLFKIPDGWSMNFYTTDAVVVQSGHILLIQRGFAPGKDLWALPGGHIDKNETSYQACVRELYEETNIKVPEKILHASHRGTKLFDDPNRSLRARVPNVIGRTVDVAHFFELSHGHELPKVKGNSDAARAWWFTFDDFTKMRSQLFEDHFFIASHFINVT